MSDDGEITWYRTPADAAVVETGLHSGWHWVKLVTAEQLATAMGQVPHFPIADIARMGGIHEPGVDKGPGGFVALKKPDGELVLIGTYCAGGIQWPTHVDPAVTATKIRTAYQEAIKCLTASAHELLAADGREAEATGAKP